MIFKGFLGLFFALFALFLYQNHTRTISLDQSGNALSFDLMVWGIAVPNHLSVSLLIGIVFVLGILVGAIFPALLRSMRPVDDYE